VSQRGSVLPTSEGVYQPLLYYISDMSRLNGQLVFIELQLATLVDQNGARAAIVWAQ
jgi:hypothetical protein